MTCTYIDAEGTFDHVWAAKLGVDPDRVILAAPDHAEESLDIAEALILSKACDIIVIDSLAFLTPMAEIEKSTSDESPGVQARVLGKATRKFVAALNHVANEEEGWKPTIFALNQIRMKIGVMYGNPETTPGGLAIGFATSTEVKLNNPKYEMDKETGRPLHADIPFRVDKNKTGVPKMEGNYRLILSDTEHKKMGQVYDEDFIVKMAEKVGLLEGAGSSWKILGRQFKGKTLIEIALLEDPSFAAEVRKALKTVLLTA
jgi:recombination protein RecA